MFPNQFNVYLHDTPADALFARASRAFSHGCVRLEQPQTLAEYVLRDQPEWTPERISEAMNGGQERTVSLKTPLPVYIGYWTASVTPDGLVQFRKDVYGIDGRLTTMLAERQQRLRVGAMAAAAMLSPVQTVAATGTVGGNSQIVPTSQMTCPKSHASSSWVESAATFTPRHFGSSRWCFESCQAVQFLRSC